MTNEELTRLEELCAKATPGPWQQYASYEDAKDGIQTESGQEIIGASIPYEESGVQNLEDAEFIAASRTALPELLTEVRRLQIDRELLKRALNWIVNDASSWGLEAEAYVQRARDTLAQLKQTKGT